MQEPQVRLRRLEASDLKAYAALVGDPRIARGAQFRPASDLNRAKRMLDTDLRSEFSFAIVFGKGYRLIGVLVLYATVSKYGGPDHHCLELGYWLAVAEQGRGYMTAAVRQVVIKMRRLKRVKRLVADVSENNPASVRVLKRNGFVSYHSILDLRYNHEDLIFERPV